MSPASSLTPRSIISLQNKLKAFAPDIDLGAPVAPTDVNDNDQAESPASGVATPLDIGSPATNLKLMRKLCQISDTPTSTEETQSVLDIEGETRLFILREEAQAENEDTVPTPANGRPAEVGRMSA
jgi:hypothetical protein